MNNLDESYEEKCTYETASWYAARQTCQQQGLQLRSYTTTSFDTECVRKDQMYWIGNHVAETIVWANGIYVYTFKESHLLNTIRIIYIVI